MKKITLEVECRRYTEVKRLAEDRLLCRVATNSTVNLWPKKRWRYWGRESYLLFSPYVHSVWSVVFSDWVNTPHRSTGETSGFVVHKKRRLNSRIVLYLSIFYWANHDGLLVKSRRQYLTWVRPFGITAVFPQTRLYVGCKLNTSYKLKGLHILYDYYHVIKYENSSIST